MTTPETADLQAILDAAAQDGSAEGRDLLDLMLEDLPMEGDLTPQGTPFEIKVLFDSRGVMQLATTRNIPNLRFRLKDLMVEVVKGIMDIATKNPLGLVISALSFLRNVNTLATLELDKGDAELLITIFRLTRDRDLLSLDDLIAATPELDAVRRSNALERLEKLACIGLEHGNVWMVETIIVTRT